MLIGGDDISNNIVILAFTCFSLFVYIHTRFRFALIDGNLKTQSMGSHRGITGGIQIPETKLQALLPFPAPPPDCPKELACKLRPAQSNISYKYKVCVICLFFAYYLVISLQKSSWKTFILKVRLYMLSMIAYK